MAGLLFVAIAGGVGAVLRYLVHQGLTLIGPASFPLGTLVVNLVGCLAIGFLAATFADHASLSHEQRLALFVGLLGGFTTFSSYGLETFTLIERGAWGLALLYFLASNGLGVLGVWLGHRMATGP